MHRFAFAVLLLSTLPAAAHEVDCSKSAGVAKARCERHVTMYGKCGALKGEEHFDCDRAYLIANPLQCGPLSGAEAARCTKEVEAFKACEGNAGIGFVKCVRKITNESPMGH